MKCIQGLVLLAAVVMVTGCATQPVEWKPGAGPIDSGKGAQVTVSAKCEMPNADLDFLQDDITKRVRDVLRGNNTAPDAYQVVVAITRYDKGNAFARFMLIGLGQMYLYGTVEVKQGDPPVVIRSGEFKKNYCVGGLAGGMATMQKTMLPKVGEAIAEGLQNPPAKP